MYKCAIKILRNYINSLPHVNAYWLVSFLDTSLNEIDEYKKQLEKTYNQSIDPEYFDNLNIAYIKRVHFGKAIFGQLDIEKQKIIEQYSKFISILKSIHKMTITNKNDSQIQNKIKEINNLILKGGKFLLPKLEYMTIRDDLKATEDYLNLSIKINSENEI